MTAEDIKTVAVLGAGTMGNGIAHVFARRRLQSHSARCRTTLVDRGMDTIGQNLAREVKKGKLTEEERGNVLERLLARHRYFNIAAADFLVEAVPEK